MEIDKPLLSFDIYGSDDNSALRSNKKEFQCRGSRSYVLSYRNEILERRGWQVPEDWDLSWTKRFGAIWTPEFETNIASWIQPEYFRAETSDPTLCIEATDRLDSTKGFEQTTAASMPTLTSTDFGTRSFNGLNFDGSNDSMDSMTTAYLNADDNDFLCAIFLDFGSDADQTILAGGIPGVKGWEIAKIASDNKLRVRITTSDIDSSADAWVAATKTIVCVGRESGTVKAWINGTEVLSSSNTADIDYAAKSVLGGFIVSGADFDGTIWEVVFIGGNGWDGTNRDKIEGYLAHKYENTGLLGAGHTYKTAPPRRVLDPNIT